LKNPNGSVKDRRDVLYVLGLKKNQLIVKEIVHVKIEFYKDVSIKQLEILQQSGCKRCWEKWSPLSYY